MIVTLHVCLLPLDIKTSEPMSIKFGMEIGFLVELRKTENILFQFSLCFSFIFKKYTYSYCTLKRNHLCGLALGFICFCFLESRTINKILYKQQISTNDCQWNIFLIFIKKKEVTFENSSLLSVGV